MGNKQNAGALHLLTAREVMAAGDGYHADGGGLYLLRRGTGLSWVFRYTSPAGKRREMGLGVALATTPRAAGECLRLARELAQAARELLRKGTDPIDEREQQRTTARQAEATKKTEKARQRLTLARCARDYHELAIEPSRSPRHAAQWISSLENHVPAALWNAPVDTITAPMLLSALMTVSPHESARNLKGDKVPETLRRIRQRLDAVFEDAIFHGHATVNPAAAIKRKLREAGAVRVTKGGFAALPYKDAPALIGRLRAMQGTAARALELAVLCAARTGEVLAAEWVELDLDAGTWCVPAARMKAKEPHIVYLPPQAIQIVRAQAGQDARLVFPSPMPGREGRPMSNMAMLTCLDRLGVRDRTTVHGLCRATFSTWANETGAARPDVIEACLAHEESNRVRAAYNRATFADERRALLAKWAEYLAGAEVIQFKRGAA